MLGFVIAVIGGFIAPRLDEPVARPLARLIAPVLRVEPGEIRLFGFVVVMLVVGILSELLDSGSTFWVILGGALGLFGQRLVDFARARIEQAKR